jgi:serine protease inhibitor
MLTEPRQEATTSVAGPSPVLMSMNHPFFYAIQDDKTGVLLFIGVLMIPN